MLSDVRSLCVKAETSAARLRRAVGGSDLPPNGAGLGAWVDEELSLRCAVSVSLAFLGARRASEIAALTEADVAVDEPAGAVELKMRCRKNDQLRVGQMAHIAALPAWRGACPIRLLADMMWFRDSLPRCRDRDGRLSAPPASAPLFVGLARARVGLRMAASEITAAWKKGLDGKNLSPRKGGARMYVVNGRAREAARELGGWKPHSSYGKCLFQGALWEVVPEMRSAAAKACNVLAATSFAEDLCRGVGSEVEEALGLLKGAAARIWCYRFATMREFLDNFLALMGRRVRLPNLSDSQRWALLLRAREFRLALKSFRNKEPASLARARATAERLRPPGQEVPLVLIN